MKISSRPSIKHLILLTVIILSTILLPAPAIRKQFVEVVEINSTQDNVDTDVSDDLDDFGNEITISKKTTESNEEVDLNRHKKTKQNVKNQSANQPKQKKKKKHTPKLSKDDAKQLIRQINDNYLATVEEINNKCDNDIATVKADTQEEISAVNKYYQAEMRALASEMRRRGLYGSGLFEDRKAKIQRKWDSAIEDILKEEDEKIEKIENYRRSQLKEAKQLRDALIQEVNAMRG